VNARLMNVEGNQIHRRSIPRRSRCTTGDGTNSINAITWPSLQRITRCAPFGDGLIKRIGGDWIANALGC
jgi:hypothetical protein